MKRTIKAYAQALFELTQNATPEMVQKITHEFTRLLARDNKLGSADKIMAQFVSIAKKKQGIVELNVTTASALTSETKEQLMKTFGSKVEIHEQIDKSLIGGLVAKTGDTILDGSIKTQLKRLKASLSV